jgi:hypothetical protein
MKTVGSARSGYCALALFAACRAAHPVDPTGPMRATCDDSNAITCVDRWLSIRPYVAAPGRVRLVTETTPRGVALPASLAGANAFYIVDVTPRDRALFAVGLCPYGGDERGEPVALAQRADGWVHVVCVNAPLGGEPGHEERWRPLRFDVYEGTVSEHGGVVDWRPPVSLPNAANDRRADRLEVQGLTATLTASVLTYDRESVGPKGYRTIATERATLDPRGGAPVIELAPTVAGSDPGLKPDVGSTAPAVPRSDPSLDSAVPANLTDREPNAPPSRPSLASGVNLSVVVDDWAVATVRAGDTTLARWQLPRASPQTAVATCDASGCVAAFVFESGGTSAIVVEQSRAR